MKFVNENIEDVLKPKGEEEIENSIKKLSFNHKFILIEELWGGDWGEFVLDINRYLGIWKFEKLMEDLIIMKQQERI